MQSFKELRSNDCIYVDKTREIYNLASCNKYYFLSRPRRFGKSLLVSTLEEFFSGNRELFEGLAIDSLLPGEWPRHPVFHFDFSRQSYFSTEDLPAILNEILGEYEKIYGRDNAQITHAQRFGGLIDRAYEQTGQRVVILIDEYDIPIINCLDNEALMDENRKLLRSFYGVMKSRDARLRFVFLTGVGKLGKLSVFSGLNNIRDITMTPAFSTICGVTENELHQYFDTGIRELAEENGWTTTEAYRRLKEMYDGYHFARDLRDVYNPFSILNCLVSRELKAYWFASGTPSHLLHVLKHSGSDLARLNGASVAETILDCADVIQYEPVPFMFYTGYLTVKSFDARREVYTMRYPNKEVERGFISNLLPIVTSKRNGETSNFVIDCCDMIEKNRIGDFMEAMKAFYAGIPYEAETRNEYFYQNVMYCIGKLLGFYIQAEYRTSAGRIDLVLANTDTIYVIEFKVGSTPEAAIAQIEQKDYTLPFALDGRHVVKVGANFDPATRTLDRWIIVGSDR